MLPTRNPSPIWWASMNDIEPELHQWFETADKDDAWKHDDPVFEWTPEDIDEFEWDRKVEENDMLAMAGWWEIEGVRCATFGRNPHQNPYLED